LLKNLIDIKYMKIIDILLLNSVYLDEELTETVHTINLIVRRSI